MARPKKIIPAKIEAATPEKSNVIMPAKVEAASSPTQLVPIQSVMPTAVKPYPKGLVSVTVESGRKIQLDRKFAEALAKNNHLIKIHG